MNFILNGKKPIASSFVKEKALNVMFRYMKSHPNG